MKLQSLASLIGLTVVAVGLTVVAAGPSAGRTMTYWAGASDMTVHGRPSCGNPPCTNWTDPAAWAARIGLIAAHRANLTGVIPCIHSIGDGGRLSVNGDGSYTNFLPHLPKLKAMGLEVTAFLGNSGSPQQAALEAAIHRGQAFVDECVQKALDNGYDGYSVDQELRCTLDAGCWARMAALRAPYMRFLNLLADGLHAHGKILTVFIDGCCGYVNPYDKSNRGCIGAEASHDYQACTCLDYANSSIDRVISHATYGGSWHDADVKGPGGAVWTLQTMAAVGAKVIGVPKLSVGIKGGFAPPMKPANQTGGLNCSTAQPHVPSGCYESFSEGGQRAIEGLHRLGIEHIAKFMDEPTTQAEWDAWGHHLHGP